MLALRNCHEGLDCRNLSRSKFTGMRSPLFQHLEHPRRWKIYPSMGHLAILICSAPLKDSLAQLTFDPPLLPIYACVAEKDPFMITVYFHHAVLRYLAISRSVQLTANQLRK